MTDAFAGRHVLSMAQYDRADLLRLFEHADLLDGESPAARLRRLPGRVLSSAFFQRSTRTRLAHESAAARLGCVPIGFADPSVTRAEDFARESVDDVVRMLAGYGDVIVLRHPDRGVPARVAARSSVPVINAGDGDGEHPTQAMADLYTLHRRFGGLDGLSVLITGDMRMRTATSLLLALARFDTDVRYVAPEGMPPDPGVLDALRACGAEPSRVPDLRAALPAADVLYVQPVVQPDVVADPSAPPPTPPEYLVDRGLVHERGAPGLLVLHPLPRHDELAADVDDSAANGYFDAAANGVTVRMALLDLMLGG